MYGQCRLQSGASPQAKADAVRPPQPQVEVSAQPPRRQDMLKEAIAVACGNDDCCRVCLNLQAIAEMSGIRLELSYYTYADDFQAGTGLIANTHCRGPRLRMLGKRELSIYWSTGRKTACTNHKAPRR